MKINRLAWNVTAGRIEVELVSGKSQTLTLRLPRAATIKSIRAEGAGIASSALGANARELELPKNRPVTVHSGMVDCRLYLSKSTFFAGFKWAASSLPTDQSRPRVTRSKYRESSTWRCCARASCRRPASCRCRCSSRP